MYNLASEVVDKGANFYRYRRVQFGLVLAFSRFASAFRKRYAPCENRFAYPDRRSESLLSRRREWVSSL